MPLVKPSLPPRPSSSAAQQERLLPKFAPCPRSTFTTGHDDWFRITSPKTYWDIDICSSCYNTTFRNTLYERCISEAPPKSKDMATRCDVSDRWNRAAIFWLFSQHFPDLTLLGTVAELPPDSDGICPNLDLQDPEVQKGSKPTATRIWYCLLDPTTGSLIEDLTVCSACVARLNVVFPCFRGVFRSVGDGQKLQATCDLLTAPNDGFRGDNYMDKIIEAAIEAQKIGTLNTRPLAQYVKKWAPIPVCVKAQHVPDGATSYTFPISIPNYAACQECYTEHILPLLESSSPPTVLREMKPNVFPTGFVCDLYSPRLQQWLKDACNSYNLETFKQRLMGREAKMQEYNLKLSQMKLQAEQLDRQAQMFRMQQQMAQNQETISAMQWNSSAYYAPPLDFSRSNAAMNQSHQAMLQAEMVRENMEMIRKEWRELYE